MIKYDLIGEIFVFHLMIAVFVLILNKSFLMIDKRLPKIIQCINLVVFFLRLFITIIP